MLYHPNLSPEINHHLNDPERNNDLDLSTVMPGVTVVFHTRNTRYECVRRTDGDWMVQGNAKYCPTPTHMRIAGSTWGGSMLKISHIGVGMHVECYLLEGPYTGGVMLTSAVSRIGDTPLQGSVS